MLGTWDGDNYSNHTSKTSLLQVVYVYLVYILSPLTDNWLLEKVEEQKWLKKYFFMIKTLCCGVGSFSVLLASQTASADELVQFCLTCIQTLL